MLFSILGLVASDFFCPNLSSLAVELGMNDSTVGVTLLAFGNGFPDVVSTFRAMQEDAAAMALGELMGAAVFTVSAVCGSILVFHAFRVHPYILVRDVGVYAAAVAMVLYFLRDGKLSFGEGLAMVVLYVGFVFFVFVGDLYVDPQLGAEAAEGERISEQSPLLTEPAMWPRYDVGTHHAHLATPMDRERPSLTPTLRHPSTLYQGTEHPRQMSLPVWYGSSSYGRDMLHSLSTDSTAQAESGAEDPWMLTSPVRHVGAEPNALTTPDTAPSLRLEIPPVGRAPCDPHPAPKTWRRIVGIALFPSLMCWKNRTLLQRLIGAASVPALFLLRTTVPLISKEEIVFHKALTHLLRAPSPDDDSPSSSVLDVCSELEARQYSLADPAFLIQTDERAQADRVLVLLQCAAVPAFVLWVFEIPGDPGVRRVLMALLTVLGVAGGVGAAQHMSRLDDCDTPEQLQRHSFIRSSVGFVVGLLWIVVSVDQVLALLHALGYICGWSEEILGLTLFAIGNSLGDIVTNLSIAWLGHPLMALSACFASPLTNLLLGMGVSATWMQLTHPSHGPYLFPPSATLLLSSYTLLVMLLLLLVVLPLNRFQTSRPLGLLFLVTYLAVMGTNVYLETHYRT